MQYHSVVPDIPNYLRLVQGDAARVMTCKILDAGFMHFERSPTDDRGMFQTRATLAVVSPTHVATLEKRVSEHQEELALEVVDEAAKWIRVWGSDSGESLIAKGRAVKAVNEALPRVLERRAATRALMGG